MTGLSPAKLELLQRWRQGNRGAPAGPTIPPRPAGRSIPLSFAQERLWFLDQLVPGDPFFNIPVVLRLDGTIDLAALEAALTAVVARHEVLRTGLTARGGVAEQQIAPPFSVVLPLVALDGLAEPAREQARLIRELTERPFDLGELPLFRMALVRLGPGEQLIVAVFHHIIADGWSIGVFLREIVEHYAALRGGRPPAAALLRVQYADYAAWQRAAMSGETLARELAFWRAKLAGVQPLQLATDRPRLALRNRGQASSNFVIEASLVERLKELSRKEGASLFMAVLAVWKVLLFRLTGEPRPHRRHAGGQPHARRAGRADQGYFVNTVISAHAARR